MLAAITLHPTGGGVAGVARLVWQALRSRWGEAARLVTLLPGEPPPAAHAGTMTRAAFAARIAAAQASGQCDWVFYSHLGLARVQRFAPPGRRRPYVVFLHGIEAWDADESRRALLAGAALRVANSAFTAGRVSERHPGIGAIEVCPPAVPPLWQEQTEQPASEVDEIGSQAVLIVARLSAAERYKGHDALLEAWPAVAARQPEARLVIAGDGDDLPRLRAKAHELGVAGQVMFTGFVSDARLASLYRRAAVFAMPSRGEGFGLAYLEAMTHGLPCVGGIHDAAREVIEDGVTGYLVDQGDVHGLAGRLLELLGDEPRRRALGEAGRRRVARCYTAGQFEARLLSLLDGVFASSEASAPAGVRRGA
jgi:glycosyltransferase involved in cell wall biosynthesis